MSYMSRKDAVASRMWSSGVGERFTTPTPPIPDHRSIVDDLSVGTRVRLNVGPHKGKLGVIETRHGTPRTVEATGETVYEVVVRGRHLVVVEGHLTAIVSKKEFDE